MYKIILNYSLKSEIRTCVFIYVCTPMFIRMCRFASVLAGVLCVVGLALGGKL